MTTRVLALDLVKLDGETQGRATTDTDHITELKVAIEAKTELPPVVVFFDGKDHWLADGFHRWHAAKAAKRGSINCEVKQGTVRDAQFYALTKANRGHGLKLSFEDKRAIVKRLLDDKEWGQKSTNWIAGECGFSRPFVEELRKKPVNIKQDATLHPVKRVGTDGKVYQKKTTKKLPSQSDEPETPAESDPPPVKTYGDTFDHGANKSEPDKFDLTEKQVPYDEMLSCLTKVSTLWNQIVKDSRDGVYAMQKRQRVEKCITDLRAPIAQARPMAACDHCKGEGCKKCQGCGWWPRSVVESLRK